MLVVQVPTEGTLLHSLLDLGLNTLSTLPPSLRHA